MSGFKELCRKCDLWYLLTYADNHAVSFFQRHGFSKEIALAPQWYRPYLKHYEGAEPMGCRIEQFQNYADFNGNIETQIDLLKGQVKSGMLSLTVFPISVGNFWSVSDSSWT